MPPRYIDSNHHRQRESHRDSADGDRVASPAACPMPRQTDHHCGRQADQWDQQVNRFHPQISFILSNDPDPGR